MLPRPPGITVAATFDVEAASLWGTTIGKEFKGVGSNMMLGPGLSLARIPHCGRECRVPFGSLVPGRLCQHVCLFSVYTVLKTEE